MESNFKQLLYSTIHRNRKTISEIADEMGISDNSLYRYGIEGESGSDMPAKRLVPLMKVTGNFELLRYMAQLCGFILVKVPKFLKPNNNHFEMVSEYQKCTLKATQEFKTFLDKPTKESYQNAVKSLQEVAEKSIADKYYCDKVQKAQFELDFDNE